MIVVWRKYTTDLSCKAGENDRGSVISSQSVQQRQPIVVLCVKQNKET